MSREYVHSGADAYAQLLVVLELLLSIGSARIEEGLFNKCYHAVDADVGKDDHETEEHDVANDGSRPVTWLLRMQEGLPDGVPVVRRKKGHEGEGGGGVPRSYSREEDHGKKSQGYEDGAYANQESEDVRPRLSNGQDGGVEGWGVVEVAQR